jgi:uncharacterized membrane protein YeaQ/YmgE (transglycosylase-associated protein family)
MRAAPVAIVITVDLQSILVWLFVGLVAGFLASKVVIGHGMGLLADIVVGILGAIAATLLFDVLNISFDVSGHPIISEIIIALLGSIILLGILRVFSGAGRGRRIR